MNDQVIVPSTPPLTPLTPLTPPAASFQSSSSPLSQDVIPPTPASIHPTPLKYDPDEHEQKQKMRAEMERKIVGDYQKQLIERMLKKDEEVKPNQELQNKLDVTFIPGTNLKITQIYEECRKYINSLKIDLSYELDEIKYEIEGSDLHRVSPFLYNLLIAFPGQVLSVFDFVLTEKVNQQIRTNIYNLNKTYSIPQLSSKNIDNLVSIECVIVYVGQIEPEEVLSFFKCSVCDFQVEQLPNLKPPETCTNCKLKAYQKVHNLCKFINRQCIHVQSKSFQSIPQTLICFLRDKLVDNVATGNIFFSFFFEYKSIFVFVF